ncbi:twin-arginine translocation signal domain-containing protein [Kribbella sp. NPDC006257]|uniref:twin-arginine translocation signal domain-containing protein n=1 Tax=Kribbella sp. NPDC006257 TaxID=3156738 RepID=UPI0033BDB8E8
MSEMSRRDLLKRTGGLAALLALTSCGSNTGRPSGGGDGGTSNVKLAQWYHQYGENGTREAALKYAKAYAAANVAVQWIPGDYGSKLASGCYRVAVRTSSRAS